MSRAQNSAPPIHLVGTQAFFPSLLAYTRSLATNTSTTTLSTSASPFPLDNVIFQSILLCLIAGDKHLILRTPEEDIGLVVKLAVWTLSTIFNLSTHRVKIKKQSISEFGSLSNIDTTPNPVDAFLKSLFLPSQSFEDDVHNSELGGIGKRKHHRQRSSRSSLRTTTSRQHHRNKSKDPPIAAPPMEYSRSHSTTDVETLNTASSLLMQETTLKHPQPRYPVSNPAVFHAHTDPLPLSSSPHGHHHKGKAASQSRNSQSVLSSNEIHKNSELPKALVISGIESTFESVQHAMSRVLGERKVVLGSNEETNLEEEGWSWDIPEQFICVYVCPWNARERPTVHKSLLDKFAMSTNVFVSQSVRKEFQIYFHLPFFASGVLVASTTHGASSTSPNPISMARPVSHHGQSRVGNSINHGHGYSDISYSNPGSPALGHPAQLPQTTAVFIQPLHTHNHFHPHAHGHGRNHRPSLSPVTSYASLSEHAQPLTPLTPYTPSPLFTPEREILPPSFILTLRYLSHERTHLSYTLTLYLYDIFSATRHNSRLDALLLSTKSEKDAEDLARAARVLGCDLTGMELVRRLSEDEEMEDDIVDDEESDNGSVTEESTMLSHHKKSPASSPRKSRLESKSKSTFKSALSGPSHHDTIAVPPSIYPNPTTTTAIDPATNLPVPKTTLLDTKLNLPLVVANIPVMDVSEVDIARIVPRIISHRVSMRSGPDDEILSSALFGATFDYRPSEVSTQKLGDGPAGGGKGQDSKSKLSELETEERERAGIGETLEQSAPVSTEMQSVKHVLVGILAEV